MRVCNTCLKEKDERAFYLRKSRGVPYRDLMCCDCRHIEYDRNKEAISVRRKTAYAARTAEQKLLHAQKQKERHLRDRERKLQVYKKHYRQNKPKLALNALRARAKEREVPFNLELSDLTQLFSCNICAICSIPTEIGGDREKKPSVDRIVPSVGYTKDNIALLCMRCNQIKNDGTAEDHERIAQWIRTKTGNI